MYDCTKTLTNISLCMASDKKHSNSWVFFNEFYSDIRVRLDTEVTLKSRKMCMVNNL